MTFKKCLLLLAVCFFALNLKAQQTKVFSHDLVSFKKAENLYKEKQYQTAQNMFSVIIKDTKDFEVESDCAYYIANCAVRLNQQNADELMEDFVKNYPTSTKRNSAYLNVATYYFENANYAYAQKWFEKVDESRLTSNQQETFNFSKGYTAFVTKNFTEAKRYLTKVENSSTYGSQAKYYLGFMAYEGDDYKSANTYFDQVSGEEKYKEKLTYYQADLNFKLGKFEEAIKLAKAQLDKSNQNEVSELNKIIGESYFNLKKYEDALPYLKAYKGKNGKWSNTDYYQLGYAYYKQKDFNNAVSEFNKIINADDTVAQNAYYHLGESYINLNKKQEALNAFRTASQMNYDLKIQEDATLNYAKLSYEVGNVYKSVPEVLNDFMQKYPDSPYKEQIENLLIDSYITSKNYKEALVVLKGKNSFENKKAFQKVAFYRGLELYNETNYIKAKDLFNSSLKEQIDEIYTARATFWLAETDYNLSSFNEALIGFKHYAGYTKASATPEFKNSDYNLAYTYFKLKDYTKSSEAFKSYIAKKPQDSNRLNDAYLRLADGYFVSSDYTNAILVYDQAIKIGEIEKDYAAFQKALSFGYLGQNEKKTQQLEQFLSTYKNSNLQDDALYTLANTYIDQSKTNEAMPTYSKLVNSFPESPLVSKALLRQGLSYYNKSDNTEALAKFKQIAKQFPATPEANQAVATARLIYIDLGQVNEYANWVKTLDFVQVTNADLDNATYQAAEKQYLDNNSKDTIKQFNAYINEFPNGLHAKEAHFYLAQLYYKDNLTENATPHFEYVVKAPKSEFTEESLLRLSQIYLASKDYWKAIPVLKRLETEANFSQNTLFAQSNIMKAYYELKKYNEADVYANKVLVNPSIDQKIKNDAKLIIARSALKTNNFEKAKLAYAEVEKTGSGESAAEALYYNAYFKTEAKQFEASNVVTQKLVKDYSTYKYYGAKGLIVMAKNFNGLNDAFQATYILESVIKNFSDFDDVVLEAKELLKAIKTEQAKTNSSVIPED
jgi:TolA-binding protein